jgi:hypothetical protein
MVLTVAGQNGQNVETIVDDATTVTVVENEDTMVTGTALIMMIEVAAAGRGVGVVVPYGTEKGIGETEGLLIERETERGKERCIVVD